MAFRQQPSQKCEAESTYQHPPNGRRSSRGPFGHTRPEQTCLPSRSNDAGTKRADLACKLNWVSMSITGMAVRRPQDRSLTLVLVCIPLLFLASGVAIRYLAFAAGAPDASFGDYVSAMCRWDCGWYLGLAEHGYEPF